MPKVSQPTQAKAGNWNELGKELSEPRKAAYAAKQLIQQVIESLS